MQMKLDERIAELTKEMEAAKEAALADLNAKIAAVKEEAEKEKEAAVQKAEEEAMEAAMEEEANSEADLAVGSVEAEVEGVDLEVAVPVAARDNIHMHLLSRIASDKIFRSSPGTRAP